MNGIKDKNSGGVGIAKPKISLENFSELSTVIIDVNKNINAKAPTINIHPAVKNSFFINKNTG